MDAGRYYTAAFLDVSQAFDKVWHAGLLHKIKSCFPPDLYTMIKSYLLQKTFRVKYGEVVTELNINRYQFWSTTRQRAETGALSAIHRRSSSCPGYHNRNLCRRYSYPDGSQKPCRSIPALTKKAIPHPDMAKKNGESESMRQNLYR